jgi:transcriptional regulator with XRE-family HTH domain
MHEETRGALIGRNIRALRDHMLFTRSELAQRAGVSIPGIDHIERGIIARPRRRTIEKIARALGVEPEDLLREEPPRPKAESRSSLEPKLFNNGVRAAEPNEEEFQAWVKNAGVSELCEEQDKWLAAYDAAKVREEEFFAARGGKPRELRPLLDMTRDLLKNDPEYRHIHEESFHAVRRIIWIDRELRRRPGQMPPEELDARHDEVLARVGA